MKDKEIPKEVTLSRDELFKLNELLIVLVDERTRGLAIALNTKGMQFSFHVQNKDRQTILFGSYSFRDSRKVLAFFIDALALNDVAGSHDPSQGYNLVLPPAFNEMPFILSALNALFFNGNEIEESVDILVDIIDTDELTLARTQQMFHLALANPTMTCQEILDAARS